MRSVAAVALACCLSACASAPQTPIVTAPQPPQPTFEQKSSWILRLADARVLRDAAVDANADLIRLLGDETARVRRQAARAIGRVGLLEGAAPLTAVLAGDADPEVRQMAAFALGLLADKSAPDPLIAALNDPSPLVE